MIYKIAIAVFIAGAVLSSVAEPTPIITDNTASESKRFNELKRPKIVIEEIQEPKVVEEAVIEYPNKLDGLQLKALLYDVGFRGDALKTAWAVAMKESTGRTRAHNDNSSTGDNSYGLFQINMRGAMGPDRRAKYALESNEDLFNPVINARIAYEMSDAGADWGPWNGITKKTKEWMSQFPD